MKNMLAGLRSWLVRFMQGRNGSDALACSGAGRTAQAQDHIRRAVAMDPGNEDCRRTLDALSGRAASYERECESHGFSTGFCEPNPAWLICCTLWLYPLLLFCR